MSPAAPPDGDGRCGTNQAVAILRDRDADIAAAFETAAFETAAFETAAFETAASRAEGAIQVVVRP